MCHDVDIFLVPVGPDEKLHTYTSFNLFQLNVLSTYMLAKHKRLTYIIIWEDILAVKADYLQLKVKILL